MHSPPEPSVRVDATLEAVRELAAHLQDCCEKAAVDTAVAFELELALVEAANNIVEHGAGGGAKSIGLVCAFDGDTITLALSDDGPRAPDGLFSKVQEVVDPLAEHGRGLMLLQACADEVEYRSECGTNTLLITRKLSRV